MFANKKFMMEIKNRNPALNLQTDSQTLSEDSMDQETTEAGLTKSKEDSILLHTQTDEISEELKRTVIKSLTTLKLTEVDRQAQQTENDASLDKQLLATKLDVIEPATQQFQMWRLDFVKQQGIIYKGARFLKQKTSLFDSKDTTRHKT